MSPSLETLKPPAAYRNSIMTRLRTRKMVAVALVSLACSSTVGLTGCTQGLQDASIGPSKGEIIGAIIGIGAGVATVAVIAVHVHHKNHRVKGCILNGPNGLEVQNDSTLFEITGATTYVKVGEVYQLNGAKLKKEKHATGNRKFEVEKVGKDFGPCTAKPQSVASNETYR